MQWDVYRNSKLIDRVWFTKNCDLQYVRDSLINHDGYPVDIVVKSAV